MDYCTVVLGCGRGGARAVLVMRGYGKSGEVLGGAGQNSFFRDLELRSELWFGVWELEGLSRGSRIESMGTISSGPYSV